MRLQRRLTVVAIVIGLMIMFQPFLDLRAGLLYPFAFAICIGAFSTLSRSPVALSGGVSLATATLFIGSESRFIGPLSGWPGLTPLAAMVFVLAAFAFALTPADVFLEARPVTAVVLGAVSSACIPPGDVYPLTISPAFSFQMLFAVLPMAAASCGIHRYIPRHLMWLTAIAEPLFLLFIGWVVIIEFAKDSAFAPRLFASYYWWGFGFPAILALLAVFIGSSIVVKARQVTA